MVLKFVLHVVHTGFTRRDLDYKLGLYSKVGWMDTAVRPSDCANSVQGSFQFRPAA